MLLPSVLYNFINNKNGKVFLGSHIDVRNLSGRMMVVYWKSKTWLFSKSKKSENYTAASEGERASDMFDDMRIQFEHKARERNREERKEVYSLFYGLFTFVLSSANAYAWYVTENKHESSFLNEAYGIGINAFFIGVMYTLIIVFHASKAIAEKRFDFNHFHRLCRFLFWFTLILSIGSFYPLIKY